MIAIAEIKETGRRETPYLGSSLLHHRSDWCRVILREEQLLCYPYLCHAVISK